MLVSTELEFNIVINEIDTIYNKNIDDVVLLYAKSLYEKTCYMNQYIYELTGLIKRSMVNIIRKDLNAKVRVFIVVSALVIKYEELDIISNMKVSEIITKGKINNMTMVECKNDHCVALLPLKDISDKEDIKYKIGDTICIKVGNISYKIGKPTILVSAYPFIPHQRQKVIYKIDSLDEQEKDYINTNIISMYKNLLEEKNNLNSDKKFQQRFNYFKDLIYPYKTINKNKFKDSDLEDVINLNLGNSYVMISDYIPFSDLKFVKINENDIVNKNDDTIIINDHAINVYQKIIFEGCKELTNLIDLTKTYICLLYTSDAADD